MSKLIRIGPRCPNCETPIWAYYNIEGKRLDTPKCLNCPLADAIRVRDDVWKAEILKWRAADIEWREAEAAAILALREEKRVRRAA